MTSLGLNNLLGVNADVNVCVYISSHIQFPAVSFARWCQHGTGGFAHTQGTIGFLPSVCCLFESKFIDDMMFDRVSPHPPPPPPPPAYSLAFPQRLFHCVGSYCASEFLGILALWICDRPIWSNFASTDCSRLPPTPALLLML